MQIAFLEPSCNGSVDWSFSCWTQPADMDHPDEFREGTENG